MENEGKTPVKILYLTYDGLTDPLGQSQILPYLRGLSELGYCYTVISFEKPVRFKELRKEIESVCIKYHIDRIPFIYHKFPPVLSTLFDLFRLKRMALKITRTYGVQIVHCRSYIPSLAGLRLKRKCGIKFLFDMRGFWADERVEGGIWNLKNPVYRMIYNYFKKKEKEMIRNADHVITLTENAKKEILGWDFGPGKIQVSGEKISVIPSCVDTGFFDPMKVNQNDRIALRNYLGIRENEFVLLYLGSLGTWYMLDEMLDFFQCLKGEIPKARFLILTNDIDYAKKKLLEKKGSAGVDQASEYFSGSSVELNIGGRKINSAFYLDGDHIILTQCPRALAPLYISLSSASIFFIKPSYSKKASSATKLGESLSMGIPVITNKGWGDVDEIFNLNIGYLINLFNRDCYIEIINKIKVNVGLTKVKSDYHYRDTLSLKENLKSLNIIYNNILINCMGSGKSQ